MNKIRTNQPFPYKEPILDENFITIDYMKKIRINQPFPYKKPILGKKFHYHRLYEENSY